MSRGPGWMRARPAKRHRPARPAGRRRRFLAIALMLASHPSQHDLMSPAWRAHAKMALGLDLRDAFAELRAALEDIRRTGA